MRTPPIPGLMIFNNRAVFNSSCPIMAENGYFSDIIDSIATIKC
jgi:hypothetical protein